ncbi:MAG: Crp/Fnr family transcriptional regulator [Anaerolineales bacterium]
MLDQSDFRPADEEDWYMVESNRIGTISLSATGISEMSRYTINHLDLFDGFDSAQMERMQMLFVPCQEGEGSILFSQGAYADHFYILVDGEVEIRYKPEDGPEINITRIRGEGIVGWSAVLGNHTFSSTAICGTGCELLQVDSSSLHDFCVTNPETGKVIIERLAEMIAERLRNTHQEVISLLEQGLRIHCNPAFST